MTERATPATDHRSPRRGREDDGRDPRRAHANPRTPRDDNDEQRAMTQCVRDDSRRGRDAREQWSDEGAPQ